HSLVIANLQGWQAQVWWVLSEKKHRSGNVRVGPDQRYGPAVGDRGKLKRRDKVGDCGKASGLEIPGGNRARNDQRRGAVNRWPRCRRLPRSGIPAAGGQ